LIGVDFRSPGTLERTQHILAEMLERSRKVRASLLVVGAFLVLIGIESIRLVGALHAVHDLDYRKNLSTERLRAMQSRVRTIEERRRSLLTGLKLRRSNAELATRVAELVDLLAPTIAVTTLRGLANGIDVEGRGTNLADVRVSLARLQAKLGEPAAVEVRREDGGQGVISFHLEIEAK
jgi:hypothetical protein